MTGDDRLRDELEALERSAPADLPPRPSAPRPRWWRRLAAPAAVVVAAVLVTVVVAPELIDAIRPLNSPHATDSGAATVSDPPAPRTGAAAEITFAGRWADCCYIEGAVTFASLSGGPTSRRDEEIAGIETWQIRPGSYELTLYHRPCDASCDALDPAAGTCTTDITIEPGEAILVSVTWHIGGPCETSLTPRPPPPNDPSSVRGTLAIDGSCVIVTDEYAYRWAIRLPDGYRVDRTTGWATALFGPDGRIAAMGGDTVTFGGHQTDVLDIGCTTGMPYVAASMDVDAAPLVWQAVSCEPPPVGAPVALACDRAISAAIGAWQGDRTTIAYFEFHYGAHCPIGARCGITPKRFDIGWVMLRTEVRADGSEKDVFVSVVADDGGAIRVTSIDPPAAT